MSITYGQIAKAIANTLTTTTGVKRVQPYDEITEAIPDLPLLQVYMDDGETDSVGENDRASFGAGFAART